MVYAVHDCICIVCVCVCVLMLVDSCIHVFTGHILYLLYIGGENYFYMPNIGLLSIFAAGLVRMTHFIMQEWEQKPVRINAVM